MRSSIIEDIDVGPLLSKLTQGLIHEEVHVHRDGAQRRRHELAVGRVIDADDGDIVRYAQPKLLRHSRRCQGDEVVVSGDTNRAVCKQRPEDLARSSTVGWNFDELGSRQ